MASLEELQTRLGRVWSMNQPGRTEEHVVVELPSFSLAPSMMAHYRTSPGPAGAPLPRRHAAAGGHPGLRAGVRDLGPPGREGARVLRRVPAGAAPAQRPLAHARCRRALRRAAAGGGRAPAAAGRARADNRDRRGPPRHDRALERHRRRGRRRRAPRPPHQRHRTGSVVAGLQERRPTGLPRDRGAHPRGPGGRPRPGRCGPGRQEDPARPPRGAGRRGQARQQRRRRRQPGHRPARRQGRTRSRGRRFADASPGPCRTGTASTSRRAVSSRSWSPGRRSPAPAPRSTSVPKARSWCSRPTSRC